jgi:hypothetical protein
VGRQLSEEKVFLKEKGAGNNLPAPSVVLILQKLPDQSPPAVMGKAQLNGVGPFRSGN